MDWTLEEFYADGGTTRFVDRIAAVLGVHTSRIKTVAIYEGSVIVDFFIEALAQATDDEEASAAELLAITTTLIEAVASNPAAFGAAVLGLESDSKLLAGDPIPGAPAAGGAGGSGTGGLTSAAFIDDNLWDRFVRIQAYEEAIRQERLESGLADADTGAGLVEAEGEEKSRGELAVDRMHQEAETDVMEAVRYTIMISIITVVVLIVVLSFCLLNCLATRKQTQTMSQAMKTQKKLKEQGDEFANVESQFVPDLDSEKKGVMFSNLRH
jgi:hypothetical protein